MKSDKHSLGFCNMDVKDVGFMLPLSAKSDQESVNSLLYYSEGHICLGKIIDKQKMTIQKVHVGETLMHLEHDVDTNVLVASSVHSNLITVTPNGQETIDQPQTLVTAFENRKILHWSASEEYKYEAGAGPAPVQYIEDITSLVIFGADRFTILDAVQLSRFEEIFCMTVAKFGNDTYVFAGTALAFPGNDNIEQGRILVFRIDSGNSRSEPSGILRQVLEKPVKSPVYGIKATATSIRALIGTSCWDVIFNPSQHTLELTNNTMIGHFVYCNSSTFNEDLSALAASDAMQSLILAKLDAPKDKDDGKIVARERHQRAFLSLNFLSNHEFIGCDSEENVTIFSDLLPKDDHHHGENGTSNNNICTELTNLGSMYLGQTVNKIRAGAPFLPIYAKPKKSNFNHRYFSSADGAVGIFANVEDDVFT
uniref:DNA damage-binding protein 1 n=1 Tax=Panagrolaimus sp. PS1159 TaxID=55785 RepID=A0AC35FCX8_9BILA